MKKPIIFIVLFCLLGTTSYLFAGLRYTYPGNVVTITNIGPDINIDGAMSHTLASSNQSEYMACSIGFSVGAEEARCYARDANGTFAIGYTSDVVMIDLIRNLSHHYRMYISITAATGEIYRITYNKRSVWLF